MKQNTYEIEKNIEKILNNQSTGFLTKNITTEIKKRLKKNQYQELIPYDGSEKNILYKGNPPKIILYKINCHNQLKHPSILGSLFALNISQDTFGDIIEYENSFYIFVLKQIAPLIKNELTMIDKYKITLNEVPLNTLNNFKRNYLEIEIIVSSLRIDTIISRLIGCNREKIKELLKDKKIILNYEPLNKPERLLQENDIFSIKKYGKYRFDKIIGKTKKENYIILIEKYI